MSFVSAIIVVGLYFNRKRAIATGIAMSGSGLGTFAYAHLTDFLLHHFDWRGTILILTGILLNGVVCGLLFRPISEYDSHSCRVSSVNIPASVDPENEAEMRKKLLEKKYKHICDEHNFHQLTVNKMPERLTMSTANMIRVPHDIPANFASAKDFSSQSNMYRDVKTIKNQMSKQDVFYSGSLANLRHRRHSATYRSHELPSSSLPKSYVFYHCVIFTSHENPFDINTFEVNFLVNNKWLKT